MKDMRRVERVMVSTPGKLMLLGEHAVVYDRPCLVAAVDQRFTVYLSRLKKQELVVEAPQVGIKFWRKSLKELGKGRVHKGVQFIEVAVKRYRERYRFRGGLRVQTWNHFSSEHGFGSSSAVTVGVLKAMHQLFGRRVSKNKLYRQCYRVVLDVQGVGSGFDVAAAIYGGVLYFVTGGKVIDKLPIGNWQLPVVVGYTGVKADTATLVRQVAEVRRRHPGRVEKIFEEITGLVDKARVCLEKADWKTLGRLMDLNQRQLSQLEVSSVELDQMIEAARKAGAWGAKLSGAGGGDCMIALVAEERRRGVEKAIKQAGGEILRVGLGAEGARKEGVSLLE